MKTSKDLFDLIRDRVEDQRLVVGKWNEYTFQYESGIGWAGLDSRFTVWRYDYIVLEINCKQLTVNDDKKIKSQIEDGLRIEKIMEAIERDEVIAIGAYQQAWRITLGGYIASKRCKWDSKGG